VRRAYGSCARFAGSIPAGGTLFQKKIQKKNTRPRVIQKMTPTAGFEPRTLRVQASDRTADLPSNIPFGNFWLQ
jgi:hypothetical protein